MKLVNFYRKPISLFVMVTFTILLCFWSTRPRLLPRRRRLKKIRERHWNRGTAAVPVSSRKRVKAQPRLKKPHKFPWLLVGAVVVVGAAALYFLVLKSTQYTLTVSLSGATGTPATTENTRKARQ